MLFNLLALTTSPTGTSGTSGTSGGIQFNIDDAAQGVLPGAETVATAGPSAGFVKILGGLFEAALIVAGVLLLLYIVWGAFEWITAGGESGKIEKARNRITQGIIGMLVLSASIALFNVIQNFLGISVLTFSGMGGGSSGGGGGTGNLNLNCKCGNSAGYAQTGDQGRLTYGGDCYQCTSGGWVKMTTNTCPAVLDCNQP